MSLKAEKWGQKNGEKIYISAPIFLPLFLGLSAQGDEPDLVSCQVNPMESAEWTMAKKRLKLPFVTEPPQFILRIERVAHDLVVYARKLLLRNRPYADWGDDRHKILAERWGQKDGKEIHISAPIFLPVSLGLSARGDEPNLVPRQVNPNVLPPSPSL